MKITKRQLRRIIKEEKQKLIEGASMEQAYMAAQQLMEDVIMELALDFHDGQLGDAAYDAKMNGETALHHILTQAASKARLG